MKTPFPALFLLPLGVLLACGNDAPQDQPVSSTFCVPDSLMHFINVAPVRRENVMNALQLNGKVTFDENKVVNVYPFVSGNVTGVKVEVGDFVRQGQVLATVRSSEIAQTDRDYLAAQTDRNVAKKNLQVVQDMTANGLLTQKDLIQAQGDVAKAEAEIARLEQVRKIYGVDQNKAYNVVAPVSGFVVVKKAINDMLLRPDNTDPLFTISNLRDVWITADVFENDIARVKLGNAVRITTLAYPDKVFAGHIEKILNVLDPDSKVMKVRVVLNNPNYLLKPEMFANVEVDSREQVPMATIPTQALVFDKSHYYVVQMEGKCNVVVREVNIYKTLDDKTYLHSGVNPGDHVIDKSQLLVYNVLSN
jgi:cobalt-zinc-cadmium efflux system membrane fusion protein